MTKHINKNPIKKKNSATKAGLVDLFGGVSCLIRKKGHYTNSSVTPTYLSMPKLALVPLFDHHSSKDKAILQ